MRPALQYTLLFLHFSAALFCQDVIVKKDSSRISCRVLELNSRKIKYFKSNNLSDHKQKIKKSEVSKVIFRNGDEIHYNQPHGKYSADTTLKIVIKESFKVKPKKTIGDFIKFNTMANLVINEADNNRPNERDTAGTHGSTRYKYYKANMRKKAGFEFGFNFLLGSSPYIKHVFGASYLRSDAEFNYTKHNVNPDSTDYNFRSSTQTLNIKSTDYYLNITNGIRLRLLNSLYFETCVSINIPTINRSHVNGVTLIRESGLSDRYYITTDSTGTKSHVKSYYAINPRMMYEFKNKQGYKFGIQASLNLNANYKASWFTIGFTYYPFKKLT